MKLLEGCMAEWRPAAQVCHLYSKIRVASGCATFLITGDTDETPSCTHMDSWNHAGLWCMPLVNKWMFETVQDCTANVELASSPVSTLRPAEWTALSPVWWQLLLLTWAQTLCKVTTAIPNLFNALVANCGLKAEVTKKNCPIASFQGQLCSLSCNNPCGKFGWHYKACGYENAHSTKYREWQLKNQKQQYCIYIVC